MRDTFSSLVVHCGAAQFISETRRIAARRCSVLEAELVYLEGKFAEARAAGGEPDPATLDLYGRLADRQRRLSEPLDWDRTAPDVDDLYTHIERRDAHKRPMARRQVSANGQDRTGEAVDASTEAAFEPGEIA